MLVATTKCSISPVTRDRYGQELAGTPAAALCSVVNMFDRVEKTSVRTDSSGSRGAADDNTVDVRLMFPARFKPLLVKDAQIVITDPRAEQGGRKLRIWRIFPRQEVTGALHHIQVDCILWA